MVINFIYICETNNQNSLNTNNDHEIWHLKSRSWLEDCC